MTLDRATEIIYLDIGRCILFGYRALYINVSL